MRKLLVSMLAIGCIAATSVAQNSTLTKSATPTKQTASAQGEQRMKPKTPDEWVTELDGVVGLNADQKVKAKTLAENREAKMKAFREEMKSGGDKEAMEAKRKELHQQQKAELAKILTPEQMTKWEAHRKEQRSQHMGDKKPRTADEQVSDLDAIVTLTADQKTRVKTAAEAKQAKMKALREQKISDEAALRAKREQIGKDYRAELDKILTAEQKEKLKAHKKEMHKVNPVK